MANVASDPPLTKLPLRFTHELIEKLMLQEPVVFPQLAWFDGRAILYSPGKLSLGDTDSREVGFPFQWSDSCLEPVKFHVAVGTPNPNRPSKVFKVKITKVEAEINPEYVSRLEAFLKGDLCLLFSEHLISTVKGNGLRMRIFPWPQWYECLSGSLVPD